MLFPRNTPAAFRVLAHLVLVLLFFVSWFLLWTEVRTIVISGERVFVKPNVGRVIGKSSSIMETYVPSTKSCFAPHDYFRPSSSKSAVSLPIINLGFPKAGTTSLSDYFKCGGLGVSHQHCLDFHAARVSKKSRLVRYCAACIREGVARGNGNPLANCGNYNAYLQLDASFPPTTCYWPQVQALEEIHEEYPNATFILNFRSSFRQWYQSVSNWYGLHNRIGKCIDQLNMTSTSIDKNSDDVPTPISPLYSKLESFYCHHVETVRQFVLDHPSHVLVEVNVQARNAGSFLEGVFGINETCWGHSNANPRNQQQEETQN